MKKTYQSPQLVYQAFTCDVIQTSIGNYDNDGDGLWGSWFFGE